MRLYATPLLSCTTTLFLILCNLLAWPTITSASPSLTHLSLNPSVPTATHSETPPIRAILARDAGQGSDHDSISNHTETTHGSPPGKTIIVNITTVIIMPSPDPNKVVHDGDYARQQESGDDPNVTDPNDSDPGSEEQIDEQLQKDKAALRRIIAILSVVGGVGAVVIVAVIVIFARLRVRKRKQRELENDESRLEYDDDNFGDGGSSHPSVLMAINDLGTSRRPRLGQQQRPSTTEMEQADTGVPMPSPTAPPAPLLSPLEPAYDPFHRRRHIVSMVSQTAPAPSAPTAKELDAMIDEGDQAPTAVYPPSSSRAHCSAHSSPCPHCDSGPLSPQEAPPPAYTPSAPPMYDLPTEPVVLDNTIPDPPSISSPPPASQIRRHSQG